MLFYEDMKDSCAGGERSSARRLIDGRGEKLILDLSLPKAGERLLDVGCGTGGRLLFFRNQGCSVTGIERFPDRVEGAIRKLGQRADVHQGRAEDLPFSDNEFDLVTLITSLEAADDPLKAIGEAVRVSRDRVCIGIWNKYALMNLSGGVYELAAASGGGRAVRFPGALELIRWVRNLLPGVPIQWGSAVFFPPAWYHHLGGLELCIPMRRNPFGAFFALSFPVQASYRTLQDVIREPLGVDSKSRQALRGVATKVMKK